MTTIYDSVYKNIFVGSKGTRKVKKLESVYRTRKMEVEAHFMYLPFGLKNVMKR